MLVWVAQSTIISLVLIILIHYLYSYFKNTLTVPKVKDLVNNPHQQYKEIINTMESQKKKMRFPLQTKDWMKI